MASALHGSRSERARLNSSFENGLSAGLSSNPYTTMEVEVPLSTPAAAPLSPTAPAAERRRLHHTIRLVSAAVVFTLLLATMAALLAAVVVRCRQEGGPGCLIPRAPVALDWGGSSALWPPRKLVSRIAFGSCSAYDISHQAVWEQVGLTEPPGRRQHLLRGWPPMPAALVFMSAA